MKIVLLAIAVMIATGFVACGGDDGETAEPLTLEERVLRESDVPGSKADPVETRETADSLDQFTALAGGHVAAAEIERSKLEEAGFVSAIQDTRFFPKTPGGAHTPDAPHIRTLVVRFKSEDGAAMGADLLHEDFGKPCPGHCATRGEEFDVSGVPDARGIRRFATAEDLKATGEEGEPFDSYMILFADGPFAYQLEGFGPPGKTSEKQIEEIAAKLHDRVKGAPPA